MLGSISSKLGVDVEMKFQNLIGMLGRTLVIRNSREFTFVSKPYRYARKFNKNNYG